LKILYDRSNYCLSVVNVVQQLFVLLLIF